jgi:protein-S-isoprenylcysteine O-methyltransferase Ste14
MKFSLQPGKNGPKQERFTWLISMRVREVIMKRKMILPPTYLVVFIIAIIALHFLFPIITLIYFPWNLIGIIPLLFGIVLNLVADQVFKDVDTTVKPNEEPKNLINDGVYLISRHPMYLGMALILLGISTLLGTLTPFVVVATFAVIMETVFIRAEEQMMEETFGIEYVEYKKKVRRWI